MHLSTENKVLNRAQPKLLNLKTTFSELQRIEL